MPWEDSRLRRCRDWTYIDYYDAKDDPEQFEKKRQELSDTLLELREKHKAGYKEAHEKRIFDLDKYDSLVKDPLIQLADMIVSAVRYTLEDKKDADDYFHMIKKHIVTFTRAL